MPRFAIPIVLVLLLIGALVFLSTRAREVPLRTIEVNVGQAADAR